MTKRIPTNNYVTHFDPSKAHHRAWLQAVLDRLVSHEPEALQDGSDLRSLWKAAVETKAVTSWEEIAKLAREAGAKYPELVAAQWALESGFGKHVSGRHNYFGLKGKGTVKSTQEEYTPGEISTIKASFIDFKSPAECVQYLVDRWYKDFMSYKGVNNAPNRNAAAQALKDQGYATDSQYAAKLIRLMDEHVPAQQPPGNPLQVPWYAQMDSTDRAQAARMCFSSSCAMLLQYLKPGTLTGPNGDDQYLKRVLTYGDTTDPQAQIRALSSFGVKAKFTKTAGWGDIERQINAGIPVPCGFLHRGPVSAPSGSGHWLIVVGYTQTHLVVHDPFGEADLVNGTTIGGVARFMRYSRQNFGLRWQVEGPATGWAVIAERVA
jgi:hypothetical protein